MTTFAVDSIHREDSKTLVCKIKNFIIDLGITI